MNIRYLAPTDDLLEISSVYEQSWKYAYKNIIPQSYLNGIPHGHWADNILRDGRKNLVVTENGSIIGTSSFSGARWDAYKAYGEIIAIYLLPEYMGKGYGRPLLGRAVRELVALGFSDVLLWVLEENSRARAFYETCGFVCGGICREDSIGGKRLREVMYEYRIS